jgi:hypothetical protein
MVEVAEMGFAKRSRYKEFTKTDDDPEVKYIAWWLRRNTRQIDRKEYVITMRDLRRILNRFGFQLITPKGNMIDICKVEQRRKFLGFGAIEEKRTRVTRTGYYSENGQVAVVDIRKLRRELNLDTEHGVDSQAFYWGTDDMTSLLAEYQDNIRRLADR